MKKSYTLLILCSLLPVFLCFYYIYFALTEDVGLGGLAIVIATYFLWIPGTFFSSIIHILLQRRLHFPRILPKKVFIIALLINLLGISSYWVMSRVVDSTTQYVMQNAPLTVSIIQDDLVPNSGNIDRPEVQYLYEYTLSVMNSGTVTLNNVPTRVTLGYINQKMSPDDWMYYTSVILGNDFTRESFPPGETILRNTLPIFTPELQEGLKKGLPLRVELFLDVDRDTLFRDRTQLFVTPSAEVENKLKMFNGFTPISTDPIQF